MTGLFTFKTPHNQNVRRLRSNRDADATLNRFADRLADHGDVAKAAAQIGKSPGYGRVLLQRLRKGLGWQAQ